MSTPEDTRTFVLSGRRITQHWDGLGWVTTEDIAETDGLFGATCDYCGAPHSATPVDNTLVCDRCRADEIETRTEAWLDAYDRKMDRHTPRWD